MSEQKTEAPGEGRGHYARNTAAVAHLPRTGESAAARLADMHGRRAMPEARTYEQRIVIPDIVEPVPVDARKRRSPPKDGDILTRPERLAKLFWSKGRKLATEVEGFYPGDMECAAVAMRIKRFEFLQHWDRIYTSGEAMSEALARIPFKTHTKSGQQAEDELGPLVQSLLFHAICELYAVEGSLCARDNVRESIWVSLPPFWGMVGKSKLVTDYAHVRYIKNAHDHDTVMRREFKDPHATPASLMAWYSSSKQSRGLLKTRWKSLVMHTREAEKILFSANIKLMCPGKAVITMWTCVGVLWGLLQGWRDAILFQPAIESRCEDRLSRSLTLQDIRTLTVELVEEAWKHGLLAMVQEDQMGLSNAHAWLLPVARIVGNITMTTGETSTWPTTSAVWLIEQEITRIEREYVYKMIHDMSDPASKNKKLTDVFDAVVKVGLHTYNPSRAGVPFQSLKPRNQPSLYTKTTDEFKLFEY